MRARDGTLECTGLSGKGKLAVDIRLFGPVDICHDGVSVALPRSGERCVLATLAIAAPQRVHVDVLVDHIWGDDPPANASATVGNYVRAVRRTVERAGGQREWLRSFRPGAYALDLDVDLVDYHRWNRLVTSARAAGATAAVALYRQALAIRRGCALADIRGRWAEHLSPVLEQGYVEAASAYFELLLDLGEHADVVVDGSRLVAEVVPTDRMIVAVLRGLAASGQRARIPEFVERAARRLAETVGVELSTEVRAVAAQLLSEPVPLPTAPVTSSPERPVSVTMIASGNGTVLQSAGDQYVLPNFPWGL